jgi:glyoxylate reductase
MKKKVILTKNYLQPAIDRLNEVFDLVVAEESGQDLAEVLKANADAEALISFLSDKIDRELMDLAPNLKIIANYAVGYNNIDVTAALEKGIYVTHTPDVLTEATADLTMALVLSVCRRILESDEYVRAGKFDGWGAKLMLGKELRGSTFGVVGLGRIGLATAKRAAGFGMKVVYYSKTRKPEIEKELGFQYARFIDVVKDADVLSLHLPYSKGVHHLFNKDTFDLMKPDAVFINAARGALMDETYLAEKLEKGELFGAGLDVYEYEPKVTERLMALKNVVMAPHVGSATNETRLEMAMMTVRGVEKAVEGEAPDFLVPEWKAK